MLLLLLILLTPNAGHSQHTVEGARIYRMLNETKDGFTVWIVDGGHVRAYIDSEFLYGGNEERYTYNPRHEIWIDNAINCQEYSYTLAHELLEVKLMANRGLTYSDAHDSALMLEHRMRLSDQRESLAHEASLTPVAPIDCDSVKELPDLPSTIALHNIYLERVRSVGGMDIWIVDGAAVRRDIFPDFGLSGDDLSFLFIPHGEIWLDNATSCDEMEYSIQTELEMRAMMAKGSDFYTAYTAAIRDVNRVRRSNYAQAAKHRKLTLAGDLHRDKGTGRGGL